MGLTNLPAVAAFALAAAITPGPNNVLVMASGANFGFRRTIPHVLGTSIGIAMMIILIGIGLTIVYDLLPVLHTGLKLVAFAYLLFLAWKIANTAPPESGSSNSRPFTLVQAAAFQWVNPKVWAMGLSVVTLYAPERSFLSVALIAMIFALVGIPANSLWAGTGTVLRKWLSNGKQIRMFNVAMAILLVASLYPIIMR